MRESEYEKVMRFEFLYDDPRLFHVERWCSRGSREGWMHLAGPASLSDLVDRYVEHLGEESFYELY